jgi:ketosteroid isomerase-like protein
MTTLTEVRPDPSDAAKYVLARTFHAALTTKDWSLLRAIASPDVTWVLPGSNAVSGPAVGIDAVIARAELIASYGLTFTLEHILVSRDNMALALHNTAQRTDAVLDEHLSTVCRIIDGRIDAIETYLSDVAGMDAFFIPLTAT